MNYINDGGELSVAQRVLKRLPQNYKLLVQTRFGGTRQFVVFS